MEAPRDVPDNAAIESVKSQYLQATGVQLDDETVLSVVYQAKSANS